MFETLSLKRIVLLLRRDFPNTRNATLILLLTLFVFLALRSLRLHSYLENQALIMGMFKSFLFLGGCLFASMAFYEAHDRRENFSWFMLPASIFEKFMAQLLLSTIVYIVFLLAGFFVVTHVVNALGDFMFQHGLGVFKPMELQLWTLIGKYFLFHSVFFLGAAYFRKRAFLKTIGVLSLFLVVLSALAVLSVYWNYPELKSMGRNIDFTSYFSFYLSYKPYFQWFVYALLPPLFWFIAYHRIRKAEICHGV